MIKQILLVGMSSVTLTLGMAYAGGSHNAHSSHHPSGASGAAIHTQQHITSHTKALIHDHKGDVKGAQKHIEKAGSAIKAHQQHHKNVGDAEAHAHHH